MTSAHAGSEGLDGVAQMPTLTADEKQPCSPMLGVSHAGGAAVTPPMPLQPDDITRLYRRHARSLLVFFQRRVHDAEAATDLLADTFAVAIERAPQFRGAGAEDAGGWLWQIAQSILREHERRDDLERRGRRLMGRERRALTDEEIERIEELAGLEQIRGAVARHLSSLPAPQAEAVRLRVVEDLSHEQIAERLGVSADTVPRPRLARAAHAERGHSPPITRPTSAKTRDRAPPRARAPDPRGARTGRAPRRARGRSTRRCPRADRGPRAGAARAWRGGPWC